MKLFVSYARIDKPYALKIIDFIHDIHEVWFDSRLYLGQNWWTEIEKHLEWCDGFVYLLSPESVKSEYCVREFEIIRQSGKHIFPILIVKDTPIPASIDADACIDFSKGITESNVKDLINSVNNAAVIIDLGNLNMTDTIAVGEVVSRVEQALQQGDYATAYAILSDVRKRGMQSHVLNFLFDEVEQHYRIEQDYQSIVELLKRESTRARGIDAFLGFNKGYPDYDPLHIRRVFAKELAAKGKPSFIGHTFISYSRKDRFTMVRLVEMLAENGVDTWVDDDITADDPAWAESVQSAIKTAKCVIVLLSPDSKQSRWVQREIAYAEMNEIPIIPILILGDYTNSVPIWLSTHQRIDATQNFDGIEGELMRAIEEVYL